MLDFLRRLFDRKSSGVHSVGDVLNIGSGPHSQAMRDAVAAINRVHQDGRLPIISVTHAAFRDRHGQFFLQGSDIAIQINLVGPHVELSTVHEVGHFLDHSGLGRPRQFASESHGVLDRWRTAVRQSRNVARLAPLLGAGTGTAETSPGRTVVEYEVDKDYLYYLGEQWDEGDFLPILVSIEAIFRDLGWM